MAIGKQGGENPRNPKVFNTMARLGGFDLKNAAELNAMNEAESNQYNEDRLAARNRGISELLYMFSDAFKGRDIQGRAQARRNNRMLMQQNQDRIARQQQLNEFITNSNIPDSQKALLGTLPFDVQAELLAKQEFGNDKDRRIVLQGGTQYYEDTGLPVISTPIEIPIDKVEQNKMILSERKEIGKNYKPVNEAVVGFKKLEDALKQKTGTAAYTSLVLFMKNLDGSVVKSDEVRAFGQAQGILGNIAKQIEETKGQGMTDEMRVSILNLAKASTKHMIDGYDDYLAGTKSAYAGISLPSESIFSGYEIDRKGLDFTPATTDFFLPRIELKKKTQWVK